MIILFKNFIKSLLPSRNYYIARYFYAKKILDKKNLGGTIIDIGAGVNGISNNDNFIAFDINIKNLKKNKNHIKCIGDAENLPFKDAPFDIIISLDTIEYIKNVNNYFLHLYRCLKEDGIILLSIPFVQKENYTFKILSNFVPKDAWDKDWYGACNFYRDIYDVPIMEKLFRVKEKKYYHKYFLKMYLMFENIFPIILKNKVVRPFMRSLFVILDYYLIKSPNIFGGVVVLLEKRIDIENNCKE